jgi:sodium/potassium-transporting ATPase subunit alpha
MLMRPDGSAGVGTLRMLHTLSSAAAPGNSHRQSLEALYEDLRSGEAGLTVVEAEARLARFGANELRVRKDTPEIVKFLREFRNFFAILLIVGGCLALLADYLDPGQGNLYIACALFGVVVLNSTFTYLQERQSEKIMESFQRMLPAMVVVLRDGEPDQVDANQLVPGDVILLSEGDRVPADCRLIEANRLTVDLSSLTGESEPQACDPTHSDEALLQSRNMLFSGSLVQSGDAKALVCRTGMSTEIGNIVELTKETEEVETPIHHELKYFIKIISGIAIFLGVSFFLISVAIGRGELASLIFAIGIIVANVPEGLLPTVTLALTMASKRMARKNALIKHLESVETLGSTTVICSDKTGTLTQNRLSVSAVAIGGRSYAAADQALLKHSRIVEACRVMVLCNNAHRTDDGYVGDATEGALLLYAGRTLPGDGLEGYERVGEEPFNSMVKRMITVCAVPGGGFEAYLKGAPEVVLDMCDRVYLDGELLPLTTVRRNHVIDGYRELAARGERGLALAIRPAADPQAPQDGYIFVAVVGMLDPARPEVPEAIRRCRSAGIRVAMLTGDYGLTAETIGRQIGLIHEHGTVIHGAELAAMRDDQLARVLDEPELIFARISPTQKLRIVRAFQAKGEVVTVTGDGVNDAPALKNADMGVAMGLRGTDVAKEASNMVLMDDNFATIVAAVEEGRTIFDNIKKFIAYILTSNVPQILPFIAYVLLDIPLPLTVVLILAIDLGTDILPALGLGAEKPETDVMHKPPRRRTERLLTRNLLFMSYGIVGMLQAAAGFFTYFVILYSGGWQWGQELATTDPLYRTAITGFFASIIICQVADVIICRTRRQSLLTVGVLTNRLVLVGIAAELLLLALIAYVPAFNTFFGTAPLEAWHLLPSVPFALLILLGDELRRVLVRRETPFVLRWLTW